MKWKTLPILTLLSLLITPLTPVYAEEAPIYIDDIEYKDSVFVIPRTSEETLVQTGSVYTTKEATKTDKGYSLGKQIGTVFKAQNKDGLLTPDGTQKENFVPDLRNGPLRESCLIPLTEGSIWVYRERPEQVFQRQTEN